MKEGMIVNTVQMIAIIFYILAGILFLISIVYFFYKDVYHALVELGNLDKKLYESTPSTSNFSSQDNPVIISNSVLQNLTVKSPPTDTKLETEDMASYMSRSSQSKKDMLSTTDDSADFISTDDIVQESSSMATVDMSLPSMEHFTMVRNIVIVHSDEHYMK